MNAICDIEIEFDDYSQVENVLKAVEVDDFDFIKSKLTDNKLKAHIESNSISSLLHTLDDYLACISVAAKVLDKN
jgi:tRNA threonylcarbamoyladenosine modification (KEOPS) complex  Pcc1 subunit